VPDLPDHLTEKILTVGAWHMGAYRVGMRLADGRVIHGVLVAWGQEIVRVEGHDEVPFEVSEIVDVIDESRTEPPPGSSRS
jgi:hypothetical protein